MKYLTNETKLFLPASTGVCKIISSEDLHVFMMWGTLIKTKDVSENVYVHMMSGTMLIRSQIVTPVRGRRRTFHLGVWSWRVMCTRVMNRDCLVLRCGDG